VTAKRKMEEDKTLLQKTWGGTWGKVISTKGKERRGRERALVRACIH
jgi:hypothetical protein